MQESVSHTIQHFAYAADNLSQLRCLAICLFIYLYT